jgi:hypothetical protein
MSGYEPPMMERFNVGQIALLPARLPVGIAVLARGLVVACSCGRLFLLWVDET